MKGQEKEPKRGNIHDEHFKHNFSQEKVAHDFLKHNLSQRVLDKVDIGTIVIEPNEFLPSRYRTGRNADLVYSLKAKEENTVYALLHVEAQSRHDPHMALRIWEYHVAIARAHVKRGGKKIPLIETFVFYNGKKEWTSPKSVAELFDDFDQYIGISLKAPFLIDLSKIQMASLQQQGAAAAPQMIMQGRAKGDFCPMLDDLFPLLKKHQQDDEQNLHYMTTIDPHADDSFLKKLSKFDPEKANDYKTMFEAALKREHKKALKLGIKEGKMEGIKEGEQQGIIKGKKQGMVEIAKQMLERGMETLLISEITGLSLGEITNMSNSSI